MQHTIQDKNNTYGDGMKKYLVGIREVHVRHVEVEAMSEEEAKNVTETYADTDMYLEYSHDMNKGLWSVREMK